MSHAPGSDPEDADPFRLAGGGELLRNAVENAAVPMFLIKPDGALVYANRAFQDHFGYSIDDVFGLAIRDIVHPDDTATMRAQTRAVADGTSKGYSAERRYRTKSGQYRWVVVSASALYHQSTEKLLYVCVQTVDIDGQKTTERALAASEARYAFLLEGAYQGVWDDDRKTGRRYYSRMWRKMRGLDPDDENLNDHQAWLERLHPDDRQRIEAMGDIADPGDKMVTLEYRERHRDGRYIWILSRGKAVEWFSDGRAARIIGTDTDITIHKMAEADLQFANMLLTTAMETSPDGILVVDVNSRIISFNRRFASMWQIPVAALQAGDDVPILEAVKSAMLDPEAFVARMRHLYAHPEEDSHDELETKDGRAIDRHTGILRTADGQYLGRVWFFRDITERKQSESRALKAARSDALTGLPNRLVFMEAIEQSIGAARRGGPEFAVLYLDLDHFKDINDTLGHPVGDQLLVAVADRLRQNARPGATVARFGGDEFAIIVSEQGGADGAALMADGLIEAMSQPFTIEGNDIRSGVSVGITLSSPEAANAETILSQADLALYRAKAEGRGGYHFFTDLMTEEVQTRVALNSELRIALDAGQLFLMYQPQIDLMTSRIIGVEALVRWRHPQKGVLAPALFIPVAERSGLIAALGQWVLHEACRQMRDWLDQGIAPDITAVNLSAVQFKRSDELERDIAATLERTGVPQHRLELELTETVLMTASRQNNDVLRNLRQLGIRLAIDDFGVGYSSLDYLRRYPADRIKLAQEFVSQITTEAGSAAIVRATIGLSRELGIPIIAEGIETKEQLDLLTAWGCREGQGYYFAHPLTAGQLEPLLRVGYVNGGAAAPKLAESRPVWR